MPQLHLERLENETITQFLDRAFIEKLTYVGEFLSVYCLDKETVAGIKQRVARHIQEIKERANKCN